MGMLRDKKIGSGYFIPDSFATNEKSEEYRNDLLAFFKKWFSVLDIDGSQPN